MGFAGRYTDEMATQRGPLPAGTPVTVRSPLGGVVALWADPERSKSLPNPLPMAEAGRIEFYAAPGSYRLEVNGSAASIEVKPDPRDASELGDDLAGPLADARAAVAGLSAGGAVRVAVEALADAIEALQRREA